MYSQSNLAEEIERSIPVLQAELHTEACEKSVYKQVHVLSEYAVSSVSGEDLDGVSQALMLADQLYKEGNPMVRNAIENSFVFQSLLCSLRLVRIAGRSSP